MRIISVRVPVRVVSEANRRDHWTVKARRAKEQRFEVGVVLRAALRKGWGRHRAGADEEIGVWLTRRAPRRLDGDNNQRALKAVRDGVADALGMDDADPRIAWHYTQERDSRYGVDVRIEW